MHGVSAIFAGSVHSLASVSLGALALAVALHVGKLSAEARAWHGIVQHAHDPPRAVRFRTTYGAFVSSIGANAILPARVGAALRVGVVRRNVPGSSVVTIAATIVLETAIEVAFGAAVIAVVLLAGSSLHPSGSAPSLSRLADAPCPARRHRLLLAGGARPRTRVPRGGRSRCLHAWREASPSCARLAPSSLEFSPGSSWPGRFGFGSVYAFLVAFHVPAAPWTALAVVAAQNVAASVPLLPGNAGTQQAAIGVALAGSASAAALLGFGVGMQAATTIADLLLGAAALALVASREDLRDALGTLRLRDAARRPIT